MARSELDPISFSILWSRLVGIVEEAASTLRHCAFSNIVSESNDCTCVLFDAEGRELAEPLNTASSFLGTLPRTLTTVLKTVSLWQPGDVVICNDPWIGTGHLFDVCMVVPIFYDGRLVAFSASVAHSPDIGGSGGRADAREVFEEGLRIPICHLYRADLPNQTVFDFIGSNVRKPSEILGDLHAQRVANAVAGQRIKDIMTEIGMSEWTSFAMDIEARCGRAMADAIKSTIPDGEYEYEIPVGNLDEGIVIRCAVRALGDGRVVVDYSGTTPQLESAINCPLQYTLVRTNYAFKTILLPNTPGNAATFRPIEVRAPEGSIVNATFPSATAARSTIGHYLPGAVMGALSKAIPERVLADGAGPCWALIINGEGSSGDKFVVYTLLAGGQGAASWGPGMDVVNFPGNAANTPVEVLERLTSLRVEAKERIRQSGGQGRNRGGDGQRMVLRALTNKEVTIAGWIDRTEFAATGLQGGGAGALGRITVNGNRVSPRERIRLSSGDRLVLETPGGGGYGLPSSHDT